MIHVLASRIKGTIIASYIKLDCIAQPNLRQICYYYVSYGYDMILIGRTINPEVRYTVVASKPRIFLIELMAIKFYLRRKMIIEKTAVDQNPSSSQVLVFVSLLIFFSGPSSCNSCIGSSLLILLKIFFIFVVRIVSKSRTVMSAVLSS